MLVNCEKCASRYQIADDKIKPTGTKVRCPRCQHTFRVFLQSTTNAEVLKVESRPPSPQAAPPKSTGSIKSEASGSSIPGLNDGTEFFQRSQDSIRKPAIPPRPATDSRLRPNFSPTPSTEVEPAVEPIASSQQRTPMKDPSPFKRGPQPTFDMDEILRSSSVSDVSNASENSRNLSEPSSSTSDEEKVEDSRTGAPRIDHAGENSSAPKPFGDATFFALQQMSKGRGNSRKWIIASLVLIIIAAGYFVMTQSPHPNTSERQDSTKNLSSTANVVFQRPMNWYRDDPNIFQDFLAQTAARPSADQKRPEVRAIVAEALILNGILNGADDQVASGLGIASSLVAAYPGAVYGFYALSTYAQWRDDIQTLSDLVQRWPTEHRADPEFRLSQIIVDGHSKDGVKNFDQVKRFIAEFPDHKRALVLLYSLYLDASEETQKNFGDRLVSEMQKATQKLKSSFGSASTLPPLLKSIDKKLVRKPQGASVPTATSNPSSVPKATEPVANLAAGETTVTQKLNERSLQRLEERRKQLMGESATRASSREETTTNAPGTAEKSQGSTTVTQKSPPPSTQTTIKSDPKKLPKPSSQLVAINREEKREKTEAEKIFERGHQLQKNNQLDDAVGMYQKALRLNPDFADAYRNLGEIYMNKKDKDRALRNFKIYLQLKPQGEDKQIVEGWISSLQ